MSSSTSKKRTLSELKETDTTTKKSTESGETKEENTENATDEMDTLGTFLKYLEAKDDTPDKTKTAVYLDQEWDDLEEGWKKEHSTPVPMDKVLHHLHYMLVSSSTEEEKQRITNEIEQIVQEAEDNEDDEDAIKKAIASRIQEFLKQEVEQLKEEIKKKEFGKALDVLIGITYGGCVENHYFWFGEQKEGKEAIEEIFHGITDGWTHLFKADKFCHDNLSLTDKHFIYAMLDRVKSLADKDGYKWTFHKTTLPPPEQLHWATEQKKYNVEIVTKSETYNEEPEVEEEEDDNEEEENEGDDGERDEDEGDGDGDDGDGDGDEEDENGESGPPTKKRKL